MKHKNYFIVLVGCGVLAVSCNGEIIRPSKGDGFMTFSATIETVSGGPSVEWREDDAISLFDYHTNNRFAIGEIDGQTTSFSGIAVPTQPKFAALYPYKSGAINVADGSMTLSLPGVQSGIAGSFDPSYLNAVAYSRDASNLDFKNLPAFLKIKVSGEHDIISVQVSANNGEKIAGTYGVRVGEEITITPGSTGSSAISMAGSSLDGTFYLLAIPQVLRGGLTVQIVRRDDLMYQKVVGEAFALTRNNVYDLGDFSTVEDGDWITAGPNPNPTLVPKLNLVKASFTEGDFNVISESGFEDYAGRDIRFRSNWRFLNAFAAAGPGRNGGVATYMNNSTAFADNVQSLAIRPHTDYRWSIWAKAEGANGVYMGIRRFPDGPLLEVPGASWIPKTEWTEQSLIFSSESYYYADVFFLSFENPTGYLAVDDMKLVPQGYEKMSMNPVSASAAPVGNTMYSTITQLGKAIFWKGIDGKLRAALSDFTLNGTHYDTAIATTDTENAGDGVNIAGILKEGTDIVPVLAPTGDAISIVPNSAFTLNGKTYLHYYAKKTAGNEFDWTVSSAGFLVSEDDGASWTKGTGVWDGAGCFTSAGICVKDGMVYMVGSKPRRTRWDDYWGNLYVARVDATKDFTDPTRWEYFNGTAWVAGDEEVCAAPTCCVTVGAVSEPALVYNAKFDRFMMIYRSNTHGGLVYRDADALGGFWSGEKIITNDDTHGLSYAPSVIEVTPDGDLIMLTPQL